MSAPTKSKRGEKRQRSTSFYVYGIVPSDVEVMEGATGVGDPPSPIHVVRHRDVAALVSEVDVDRPLGRPDDLIAHEQVLDATAADAPVLPIRFGAVLTNADAVTEELLEPHHDEFARALSQMEGKAEYVVKARYVEDAILGEILSEDGTARALRDDLREQPEELTRDQRIQLGELINHAIEAKREADTDAVVQAVEPVAVATAVRPPTHDQDAAHVALLAEMNREDDLEEALGRVAEQWTGRVTVRLLGPLAPYDFVVTPEQEPTS